MHTTAAFAAPCGVTATSASSFAAKRVQSVRPASRVVVSRRPRLRAAPLVPACALASEAATGTVKVYPEQDVAVGDTLRLEYTPPPGLFAADSDSDEIVFWAGGFNGWSGGEDDETVLFPLLRLGTGSYRVSVCVPDFANSVQFGFCDMSGFKWDLNGGDLYKIPVKYRKRVGSDGEVETFVASDDGSEAEDQEFGRDLARESASGPVISSDEENTLHRIRGEATLVGEEAGLGSVFISEVRDTFARFDEKSNGTVPIDAVQKMLESLSFDLTQERRDELVAKYVSRDDICDMTEFMSLYVELELDDEGLEIV